MQTPFYGRSLTTTSVPSKFKGTSIAVGRKIISTPSKDGFFDDIFLWFIQIISPGGFQDIREARNRFEFLYHMRCAGADFSKKRTQYIAKAIELNLDPEEFLHDHFNEWVLD